MSRENPKEFKKVINGVEVTAYNDSGSQWVCNCYGVDAQRFDQRRFTRKHAMEFMANQAKTIKEGQ